jgi:PAS domain S-box-containing protein
MKDENKTKWQLLSELVKLRQRVAELEALDTERKRAEEEIRRAKEEWERTFDAIPDLIAILDDEQRIVRSNNAMASGLGLSLEELVGTKCYHCFHGAEEPPLSCPFIPMTQDGQTHSEELYVERVGRDFLVTTSPLYDAQGRVSGGVHVAHDITDRKRAEEALKERMRFETVLSDLSATLVNLPVSEVGQAIQRGLESIVEFLDVDQGTLSEFSEGQARLYNIHSYSRPGIPPASAMMASDEFPWHIGRLRQGEMILMERIDDLPAEAARDKDSALKKMGIKSHLAIPLTVGGAALGVISFGSFRRERAWPRDVIPRLRLIGEIFASTLARKRAEEALARHDREMATLYETSLEINSQPDVSTLIHAIVRRAAELLGTQTGALYLVGTDGETLKLVVSHNLPPHWVGITLRLGEGLAGRVAQTGEPMMVDDYLHWEEWVDAFADTPARRVLGVPLKVRDQITGVIIVIDPQQVGLFSEDEVRLLSLFADQAAIAVENARLVEALRQSNVELEARNEELDAFAHTVAHDLKNPVGLMIGYAETLAQDYSAISDDQRQRFLQTIARNARKMNSIIEELLLLAEVRQVQVATEPLDMSGIVSEAL